MYWAYREHHNDHKTRNIATTTRAVHWAYRKHTDYNQGCVLDKWETSHYNHKQELCIGHTGEEGASHWPQYELCIGQTRSIILTTISAGSGPSPGCGFISTTCCTSHVFHSWLVVTNWTKGTVCVVHRILASWTLCCNNIQCSYQILM